LKAFNRLSQKKREKS